MSRSSHTDEEVLSTTSITKIDHDISQLNLEAIEFKLVVDEGWDISKVDIVEKEYRIFLHAIRHYSRLNLVPSKNVDTFWHHHILDTVKYIDDCNVLFGRYIHHYPYAGALSFDDAAHQNKRFDKTQSIIRNIRGF